MNWKIVFIAGLAFFVATWLVSFVTGPLLHNGILVDDYQATAQFWRPELMQQPPDMAALLPRWILTGLVGAFVVAGFYGVVRSSLVGAGWKRGLKYGFAISLLWVSFMAAYSGIFNLPDTIWAWWALETLVIYLIGGVALGWVAEKIAPPGASA